MKPRAVALGLWLGLLTFAACADGERRAAPVAPKAQPADKPALRIVALTDLSGYLEPCGCQSRPLGGIDKAAAQVLALRAEGVPTLLFAAGDLLFGEKPKHAGSEQEAVTQETWKAETLVDILAKLELHAAAPGPHDFAYGAATFEKLTQGRSARMLPQLPTETATPEAVTGIVTKAGGVSVGVLGLSTFALPDATLDAARENALTRAAQSQVDALRSQGVQVVIALASTNRRTGRRLAGALRGVDFWLQGGLSDAEVAPPSLVGDSVLLRAGRHGHGLLVLDVHLGDGPGFVDVSEWSMREQQKALHGRVRDLEERIAQWQRDPNVDAANLQEQRGKLASLRAQLQSTARPSVAGRNAFDARFIELAPEVQGDAVTSARMDAYDARVNEHNKLAFANVLPPEPAKGAARYVGSETCKGCHKPAHAWWTAHAHGDAYTTLVSRHKEFNLSCVGCHVTGYGKPGGSTVVHNQGLTHVGCESCHGAGSLHVASPDDEPALGITRSPGAGVCLECHTPEHSDLFDFATYQARLRAPGHGLPLTAAPPAGAAP